MYRAGLFAIEDESTDVACLLLYGSQDFPGKLLASFFPPLPTHEKKLPVLVTHGRLLPRITQESFTLATLPACFRLGMNLPTLVNYFYMVPRISQASFSLPSFHRCLPMKKLPALVTHGLLFPVYFYMISIIS